MKITRKIVSFLFMLVISFIMINNVHGVDEYYIINIDKNNVLKVEKVFGDTKEEVTYNNTNPYTIDGVLSYNTETNQLTINEGIKIKLIETYKDLSITTNDKDVVINEINLREGDILEIFNSKISYDDSLESVLSGINATNILITNSEVTYKTGDIIANDDLFIEKSTINADSMYAKKAVIKITDSKIETSNMTGGFTWGDTNQGIDWLDPNDYKIMGDNGRAYYGIIFVDSDIKIRNNRNNGQGNISSNRGILIKNTNVNDISTIEKNVAYTIEAGNSGADVIENTRSINIDNSTITAKGFIETNDNMDLIINNSTVVSDYSISTNTDIKASGGNLIITDSLISSKVYINGTDNTESRSALIVDGNLTISNSKLKLDARGNEQSIVPIAYTGKINIDKLTALNMKGDVLVTDIDISNINYNRRMVKEDENKKIYTVGVKNNDGTLNEDESDYVIIGNAKDVTISIENGTWADGTTEDKSLKIIEGEELTIDKLPQGMKSSDGSTNGHWNKNLPFIVEDDINLTYVFEFENPNTIDNLSIYLILGTVSIIAIFSIFYFKRRLV